MCDRYFRGADAQHVAAFLQATDLSAASLPTPSSDEAQRDSAQPVVRLNNTAATRELVVMNWGMIPFGDPGGVEAWRPSRTLARADKLLTKRTWSVSFQNRRCLVPAHAFYIAEYVGRRKQRRHAFFRSDSKLFAFAGLWSSFHSGGRHVHCFAIITTAANTLVQRVQSRMPVILAENTYDRWLDCSAKFPPYDLLKPYDAHQMESEVEE